MRQRKSSFAAIFLALFLFLFFVFGLTIVRRWQQRTWIADTAFRVLLIQKQTQEVTVLTVWPGLQEPVLLTIPQELYLTAVGGYGNYTSQALLTLGKTEGVGEQLLVDSVAFTIAGPIHDVFWYSGDVPSMGQLKIRLFEQGLMGKRSLGESIGMMKLLDRVTWSTITSFELATTAGMRQRIEVDGSVQHYLDQPLLMAFMEQNYATLWTEAADTQIAIINASNMAQMASVWSRIARLGGFDVVSVTDMPSQRQETTLLFSTKELRESQVGRALATLYPLAKVEIGDTTLYRADVALLVGLDSWQWLSQRAAYLSTKR